MRAPRRPEWPGAMAKGRIMSGPVPMFKRTLGVTSGMCRTVKGVR
jgi:hypothetical protein